MFVPQMVLLARPVVDGCLSMTCSVFSTSCLGAPDNIELRVKTQDCTSSNSSSHDHIVRFTTNAPPCCHGFCDRQPTLLGATNSCLKTRPSARSFLSTNHFGGVAGPMLASFGNRLPDPVECKCYLVSSSTHNREDSQVPDIRRVCGQVQHNFVDCSKISPSSAPSPHSCLRSDGTQKPRVKKKKKKKTVTHTEKTANTVD